MSENKSENNGGFKNSLIVISNRLPFVLKRNPVDNSLTRIAR